MTAGGGRTSIMPLASATAREGKPVVSYSFKRQFIDPIKRGTKRQTIRADRKRHARPGEP